MQNYRPNSTERALFQYLILPIILLVVLYVVFIMTDGFVKTTPSFSTPGWTFFGITATAIGAFITYNWLQGLRRFF